MTGSDATDRLCSVVLTGCEDAEQSSGIRGTRSPNADMLPRTTWACDRLVLSKRDSQARAAAVAPDQPKGGHKTYD